MQSSEDPTLPSTGKRKPPIRSFGGYEIEGELGRGGMGVVYLALQVELNRHVALKMLTGHYGPDELRRFLEEAETAAGLNHTNIAHIYEVGEHEGAPFFSMEYVEAGSLADRLRREEIPTQDAAHLLMTVARALHHAHESGVVHRDMKPGNVLLDPDGVPKVADFGIAKRLNEDSQLTRSGVVLGTPTYMAPEQAKGNSRHVGPPADVYSLGAILYEMLAGRPPFLPEDSETPITVRVLTDEPVSPAWHRPQIPRDLEVICMKCLEKEPHRRYASAEALADDLERFLEDESIHAKPPTTIARSVKWVRRNPWKFVAGAVVLLMAAAGLALLARWELYQRPRLEYATRVIWVNGGLEPIAKISKDEAARSAAHLRLTRRGRRGRITRVEILNARGNPAVLRRILHNEMVPLYIEGLAGAQPYAEKPPETTDLEISYDGETALEALGRDRNGIINWRIVYDRPTAADASNKTARAHYVNAHGFNKTGVNGASHMQFERDVKGRDVKINFFNEAGKPAPNGEGVYGYKLELDDVGHITQLVNLGADGAPVANRVNLISYAMKWGVKDLRFEIRDANGQPAEWDGVATTLIEYDDAGNSIRMSNFGSDGKLATLENNQWSLMEMTRNDHGELIKRTLAKAEAGGGVKQISQMNIGYDQYGHPADIQFAGETSWRSAYQSNANGNVIEERNLDGKGQPAAGARGFAITRYSYTRSAEGLRKEETYFDEAGNKTYNSGGYHRFINEYDQTGNLRRQTMDEHNPAQYNYHRYVAEPEYDAAGLVRHSTARFEDAQGKIPTTPDIVYSSSEYFYDENGRITTEWKFGCNLEVFGGPTVRTDTEWRSNGKMIRRLNQVCDEKRQPLPFIPTGNPAHTEEDFNSNGQHERIYETGFDETLVGYSKREAKFRGGKLESVVHTRNDGSVLESVRMIVVAVIPPPGQPKSAELRAGDQLLNANGKVFPNSYAWVTEYFPGGSIEVLREGKRVRIVGFVPGPLGIGLQDRK